MTEDEKRPAGRLYLVTTPIGNLEDMTFRAVRTLREADLIAAEDTRNSMKLLTHFDIHTPMTSYHEFNKIPKGKQLVERMSAGETVALITDAGMPGISDPGEELVKMAIEAGLAVSAVPGACAAVTGLTISGQATRRFCFEAFLPADKKERGQVLEELRTETRTIVLYEAPHRLVRTLEELEKTLGDRRVSLCRELTKKHESVEVTTLSKALAAFHDGAQPRGEYVIVLEGRDRGDVVHERQEQNAAAMTLTEHMALYLGKGLDRKEAMKAVAKDRGLSRRDVYRMLLEAEDAENAEDE